MKTIPIPNHGPVDESLPLDKRVRQVEMAMTSVRRNFEALGKRLIDARNVTDEGIELRNLNEDLYGTADDLTNLRFGDAEARGTVFGRLAPADHKHRLDPVLVMERADPTALAASTNNWAIGTDNTLNYFSATLAVNVTGIAGGTNGKVLILVNKGTFTVTFTHQDALSLAENRFAFSGGANITVAANGTLMVEYDSTLQRWRDIGFSIGGVGGGVAPADASYLVLGAHATLANERVFTLGTALSAVDGGAGGPYTLSVTASTTPTPSLIPIALGTGKLAAGWITEVLLTTDLTDVSATTGTGTTIVFNNTPTLLSPIIADFTNALHDHLDADDGGTLSAAAITSGTLPVARGGTNTSSWTAGRVVFAGTGGTSLTEDAALTWDNTTKRLGIGSVGTVNADLTISSDTQSLFTISTSTATAASGNDLLFRRSRGTHAAPSVVSNGDEIAEFRFAGYNDAYRSAAVMRVEIDGVVAATGSDMPGRFIWLVSPDGSATPVRRLAVLASGEVNVGDAGPLGIDFSVSKNSSAVDLATGILGADNAQSYFGIGDAVTGFAWLWLYWGVNYGSKYLMLYNVGTGIAPLQCDPNTDYNMVNSNFTTTPSAHLDLQGSLGLRSADTTSLAAGTYNDFDIITDAGAELTIYRVQTAGAITFNGFLAPAGDQVRSMLLINVSADNVSVTHQNAGSAAANRVITATAATVVLGANDSALLWYDNTTDRWRMVMREQ